jgi:hypothetical protein
MQCKTMEELMLLRLSIAVLLGGVIVIWVAQQTKTWRRKHLEKCYRRQYANSNRKNNH